MPLAGSDRSPEALHRLLTVFGQYTLHELLRYETFLTEVEERQSVMVLEGCVVRRLALLIRPNRSLDTRMLPVVLFVLDKVHICGRVLILLFRGRWVEITLRADSHL